MIYDYITNLDYIACWIVFALDGETVQNTYYLFFAFIFSTALKSQHPKKLRLGSG